MIENRYFIGSNFIVNDIHDDVRFGNNPFNYTHFEENYVNNKNASILLDYHVSLPEDRLQVSFNKDYRRKNDCNL